MPDLSAKDNQQEAYQTLAQPVTLNTPIETAPKAATTAIPESRGPHKRKAGNSNSSPSPDNSPVSPSKVQEDLPQQPTERPRGRSPTSKRARSAATTSDLSSTRPSPSAMPDYGGSSKKGEKGSKGKGGKKESGKGSGRKDREETVESEQMEDESSSQRGRSRSGYN